MRFNRTYNGMSALLVRQNLKELAGFFELGTTLVVDPKRELISFLEKNNIPVKPIIKCKKTQEHIVHVSNKKEGE